MAGGYPSRRNVVNVDRYNQPISAERPYLTAAEAAAYLGVSLKTLYAYASRGLVASEPDPTLGRRRRRYVRAALDVLMAQQERRRDPSLRAQGALRWGPPVLDSSLTLIAGGRLFYRGEDACELSRGATLEQVAALLWTGDMEAAVGPFAPASRPVRPPRSVDGVADRLVAALVAARANPPVTLASADGAALAAAAATVGVLFEAAGARGSGTLAERLARGWGSDRARDLNAALILCADHELNTSAFTARCVASTDAPIENVLLAALCALEGRRHGGATTNFVEPLLEDAARIGAQEACARQLRAQGRLAGFGHPLYPSSTDAAGDPRATEIMSRVSLAATDAVSQVTAVARGLGLTPSLDFALVALARALELPPGSPFALFALGRSVGWVAHALEAAAEGRLIRPRARYVGPPPAATVARGPSRRGA